MTASPPPPDAPVVLWAEDAPSDQRLILEAVADLGTRANIEFLDDGLPLVQEAIRRRPGLIVLDVNMPRMGGVEALMQLRRHRSTKDTPVVLFSTHRSDAQVSLCLGLGATAYVEKPFMLGQYATAVAQVLRHAVVRRRPR